MMNLLDEIEAMVLSMQARDTDQLGANRAWLE